MKRCLCVCAALTVLAVCSGRSAAADFSAADLEFFEKKIRPLFDTHCYECHAKGKREGGLSLATRDGMLKGGDSLQAAVVPGDPDKSPLIDAVQQKDILKMPKKYKLKDEEIADLTTWIKRGAAWPTTPTTDVALRTGGDTISKEERAFWSFQPIKNPPLPDVKDKRWCQQPLDHFILAKLEEKGLHPVAAADKRALIRRATFDLIGLPPTPAEIDAFLADDSLEAFAQVVDRLLASPHYGERWARHWLDVARYGEDQAHTFQARVFPYGYRYRDWVIKAFQDDMPYDRFVIEQIAGDLLKTGDAKEHLPALGFFALGPHYYMDAGEVKAAEAAELDDKLDTLCRGFLGLTVACARCHDHKFDPITTKDYYALAGVFKSTKYVEAPMGTAAELEKFNQAQENIKQQEAKVKEFLDAERLKQLEAQCGETAKYLVAVWKFHNVRKTQTELTSIDFATSEKLYATAFDRWLKYLYDEGNRSNAANLYLAGWLKTLAELGANKDLSADKDALESVTKAAQAYQAELLAVLKERDELAKEHKELDKPKADWLKDLFGVKGVFKVEAKQAEILLPDEAKKTLAGLKKEVERLKNAEAARLPVVHTLEDGTGENMKIYLRGNPKTEGDVVERRFLRILSDENAKPFTQGSGRLELAESIANPKNPLTARVMVNRIWQRHFGVGIVPTPSNFGKLGQKPTHPELLDYLATRFIAEGWSVKKLHREIMLSATYQLSSMPDDADRKADPANELYGRMNRRRLDVEAWRDALLMVSGNLDRLIGGPSMDLNLTSNRRRTLYGAVSRHNLNGLLRLFDFPDPNLTAEKRPVTTVPLQQLFVLNSEFMVEQAHGLVKQLAAEKDDMAKIQKAFLQLYGRPANEHEINLGLDFLAASEPAGEAKSKLSRWEQYAQVLLATNEFTFVD